MEGYSGLGFFYRNTITMWWLTSDSSTKEVEGGVVVVIVEKICREKEADDARLFIWVSRLVVRKVR